MQKYIDFKGKINNELLKEAAQIINYGGTVVFPTETVYGIGVDGLNSVAIKKLYDIKNRPLNKPISLLVSDINMIESVAKDITETEYKIIERFLPGPLTIVLKKKKIIPDILTSNMDTVGIRIPNSEIAKRLIEIVGKPIATSSANISGKASGVDVDDIKADLGNKVDCFIDGGKSELGVSSTVIKINKRKINILRKGVITEEDILKVL